VDSYALSEAYKLVALDAAEEARRRRGRGMEQTWRGSRGLLQRFNSIGRVCEIARQASLKDQNLR